MFPLGNLSVETFLRDYWQKKPLLIKQGWPGFNSPISPEELAGLALEPMVESRLLHHADKQWQLAHGPFTDDDFTQLPESNWTLLVQAVDHWYPEAAELLQAFRFIPDWRRDDLMVSYAVPGGTVGPHFDNYDVFLLQGQGRRIWRLGQQCDEQTPLTGHPELRLLQDFDESACYQLEPGDLLYLPPGLAHCGSCDEPSMSFSIGFRAPSAREMLDSFCTFLLERVDADLRYSDPDIAIQTDASELTSTAQHKVQQLLNPYLNNPALLNEWFGRHMSEAKYPELTPEVEPIAPGTLSPGGYFERTPGSRLIWSRNGEQLCLFADGASLQVSDVLEAEIKSLCDQGVITLPDEASEELTELVTLLLQQGTLMPVESETGASYGEQ